MSFAARLAQLDGAYESAEATSFSDHPPFKGNAEVRVARLEEANFETDNGAKPVFLNVHFATTHGIAFGNIQLTDHNSEKALSFAKGQLANLGFNDRLSQIEGYIPTLLGATVEIQVVHNPKKDANGQPIVTGTGPDGKPIYDCHINTYARKLVAAAPVGFQQQAAPAQNQFAQAEPVAQQAPAQAAPFQQAPPVQQQQAAPAFMAPPAQAATPNLPFQQQ